MHTAEHILNQAMVQMFGCERSKSSHIERKKSKCDYWLLQAPTEAQIVEIENRVNEVIERNLSVSTAFSDKANLPASIDTSKLPDDVSQTLRLVYIGDYDVCCCIGDHVNNTSEIGKFNIVSTDYTEGRLRIRFKLQERG